MDDISLSTSANATSRGNGMSPRNSGWIQLNRTNKTRGGNLKMPKGDYYGVLKEKLYTIRPGKDQRGEYVVLKIFIQEPPEEKWVLERQVRLVPADES